MTWSRFTASFCHTLSPSQGPDDSLARFGFAAGHGIDPEATTTCLGAMASTWAVATIGDRRAEVRSILRHFRGPKVTRCAAPHWDPRPPHGATECSWPRVQ